MLHSSNTRGMASWDRPPSPTTGSQNTYVLKEGGGGGMGVEGRRGVKGGGRWKGMEWGC